MVGLLMITFPVVVRMRQMKENTALHGIVYPITGNVLITCSV